MVAVSEGESGAEGGILGNLDGVNPAGGQQENRRRTTGDESPGSVMAIV
jgi:hypothetical protein